MKELFALLGGVATFALGANVAEAQAVVGDTKTIQEVQDIVVTAQKRSESLQDVPIAISAVTAARISAAGVVRVEELQNVVPGVNIGRQGMATEIYIRGVGTAGGAAGQENAVATFVDGVYMPSQTAATFGLNNIERVEVLKGPQGTLYGRNALGGAVNIITRDPSADPSLKAEVSYGNHNMTEAKVYANGGIAEGVAADLALNYFNQADGFGKNITTGKDANKRRDFGARSKLLLEPGDDTTITLAADYAKSSGDVGVAYKTPTEQSIAWKTGRKGWPYGFWDIESDFKPHFSIKNWGFSGRIEQDFGWSRLTSITAYRGIDGRQTFDIDVGPLPEFRAQQYQRDRQFTQELQLASASDSNVTWIAGLFYLKGPSEYRPFHIFGDFFTQNAGFTDNYIFGRQDTTSYAAFAQTTFEVLPNTNLTLGGRYTIDKRHLKGRATVILNDGTQVEAFNTDQSKTFKKPTWRIAIDHKIDDVLLYASYTRGFHSGLFNTTSADPAVKPEVLDSYEVGVKSKLFDRRLRLNLSGFYYDYDNLQLRKIVGGIQTLLNAAKARMYGLDVDFEAQLSDSISLSGGGLLIHDRYTRFADAPYSLPNPAFPYGNIVFAGEAKGNRLARTPDYSFNIGVNHNVALAGSELNTSLNYAYSGKIFFEADNRIKQKAYGVLGGQVQWTAGGGGYYIRLFSRNLTNEKYLIQVSTTPLGDLSPVAPGRTYGLAIGLNL